MFTRMLWGNTNNSSSVIRSGMMYFTWHVSHWFMTLKLHEISCRIGNLTSFFLSSLHWWLQSIWMSARGAQKESDELKRRFAVAEVLNSVFFFCTYYFFFCNFISIHKLPYSFVFLFGIFYHLENIYLFILSLWISIWSKWTHWFYQPTGWSYFFSQCLQRVSSIRKVFKVV